MSEPRSDQERHFAYFTPKRRRASIYEEVTVDTQPSIRRHVDRGYPLHFDDGRPAWWESSTALRSGDWYGFRDPGELWERTFYQKEAAYEQEMESAIQQADQDDLLGQVNARWMDFLRRHLQAMAYVDNGLWLALAVSARACLSDSIAHCVGLEAACKQRSAQALVLLALELDQRAGGFSITAARRQFLESPSWASARSFLEDLAALTDWGEVIVAANLCFEPLVGVLLRRELLGTLAPAYADPLSPVAARAAQLEWGWARAWSAEFVAHVLADAEHGVRNRDLVEGWLRRWMPRARRAARDLEAMLADDPAVAGLRGAASRVARQATRWHAELGLSGGRR